MNARILGVAMKNATRAAGLAPTEGMHRLGHTFALLERNWGETRKEALSRS